MRNYEITFNDEEYFLALEQLEGFLNANCDADAEQMTMPVLSISPSGFGIAQIGSEMSEWFSLAIDVALITGGRIASVTASELQTLLFNERVGHDVVEAVVSAMAWIKDVQRQGLNTVNARKIKRNFGTISAAIFDGLTSL